MEETFARILLGHLVGDYLLQTKVMALRKSEKSWAGFGWCLGHCIIYTAAVCLFLRTASPLIIVLVFLTHFPFDRWSLVNKWLGLIKARTIKDAVLNGNQIDLIFSCLIYAVADNTLHLVGLWLVVKLV